MAYKSVPIETTVAAAISDAFAEFTSLAEEMRETADNMEGANMGHLPKCEAASAAADELENHDSEPDIPEFLGELKVSTFEQRNKNKRRANSRAVRLSNAQGLIQAARDAVQEWHDNADAELEKDDSDAKVDEKENTLEDRKSEADQLIQDLDEHAEFDVDFPGMYG